jgi:hypothetical protein
MKCLAYVIFESGVWFGVAYAVCIVCDMLQCNSAVNLCLDMWKVRGKSRYFVSAEWFERFCEITTVNSLIS